MSREIPNVCTTTKNGAKMVLECSLQTAYSQFLGENPDISLSYSKFAKLHPQNIKTMHNMKLLQCLCEYCVNVDFMLQSLHKKCVQVGCTESAIQHKYEASSLTLCPFEGHFPQKSCIDRECSKCGVAKVRDKLSAFVELHGKEDIKWKSWVTETYMKTTKDGSELSQQQAKHMVLKENSGTVKHLVQALTENLVPFSKHLFNAKWQGLQFRNLTNNIPDDWVVLCLDFGENFNCHYQDEAQSAHWSYNQATVHVVVAYYHCPQLECNLPVRESIVFISDDNKHDYHAVQHYIHMTNKYLSSIGVAIKHQVHFSDGSPTQYKCRVNFVDASHGQDDFEFRVDKHYFGSRHGKGPCDGEVGVVKRCALNSVKTRKVIIGNAHDLYDFCCQGLSLPKVDGDHVHQKRCFMYVSPGEVDRSRSGRTDGIKAVKNTRMLHSFQGVQPFKIVVKERSCFCCVCIDTEPGHAGICENQRFTGVGYPVTLKPSKSLNGGRIPDASGTEPIDSTQKVPPASSSIMDRENSDDSIQTGAYVAVKFPTATKSSPQALVIYMAMVLSRLPDAIRVKFMRRHQKRYYYWPEEQDHIHPLSDVAAVFSAPTVKEDKRAIVYMFSEEELNNLKHQLPIILK